MSLLLTGVAARAQAPNWTQLSAASNGTGAYSYTQASAADAAGNVYLAGAFFGTVSFGTTVLTSNSQTSSIIPDGFVAKWNIATGAFVWAMKLGGPANDQVNAVAVSNGSVYVAGYFASSTATFGSLSLANTTTNGNADMFVAKLTDAGSSASFGWAQSFGSTGGENFTSMAVSGSNLYLTGTYSSPMLTVGNSTLTNAGSNTLDMLVVKLTDAGPTLETNWALGFGGSGADDARGLMLSGNSLYFVSSFTSPTLTLGATTLASAGATDAAIVKLADAGSTASVLWALRAGGPGDDTGDGLALSGTNLYVTGSYSGSSVTLGTTVLPNAGSAGTVDVFVAKLLDAGVSASFSWAQAAGGNGNERPRAVAARGANVYVAGGYGYPNATFGPTLLTNRGAGASSDIFVAKLLDGGASGAFSWAQSAGSASGETAYGLNLVNSLVVVSGGVSVPADFGTLTLPAGGTTAMAFVATLPDVALAATPAATDEARVLFPNPAHTSTTVQLPASPGGGTASLTLFDALGRAVRHDLVLLSPTSPQRHEVSVAGCAPGLYVLRVRAGTFTTTHRLVVE